MFPQKKCETGRSQSLLEVQAWDSLRKAVSQQSCPRRVPGTNDQAKKRDRDTPGKREEEEIENCPGYYNCSWHRPVATWEFHDPAGHVCNLTWNLTVHNPVPLEGAGDQRWSSCPGGICKVVVCAHTPGKAQGLDGNLLFCMLATLCFWKLSGNPSLVCLRADETWDHVDLDPR